MEASRFDDLTKALATATSRRQALKTIAATTLGSILGLTGISTAFAKCHNPGHNCEENSTCCSQNCCIAAGQKEGVCCDKGQICSNGTCVTSGCPNPSDCGNPGCNGNIECLCDAKVEGGSSCDSIAFQCYPCSKDSDCAAIGWSVCARCSSGCPSGTYCTVPCGTAPPSGGVTLSAGRRF